MLCCTTASTVVVNNSKCFQEKKGKGQGQRLLIYIDSDTGHLTLFENLTSSALNRSRNFERGWLAKLLIITAIK